MQQMQTADIEVHLMEEALQRHKDAKVKVMKSRVANWAPVFSPQDFLEQHPEPQTEDF